MAGWGTRAAVLGAVLLAVFLNYPPPEMSGDLVEWMRTGKYFVYKGHKIFYKDGLGSAPEQPVVVCIHGFPTFSYDWIKIWPSLLSRFSRVVAMDMIGFGFSDKPQDHSYTIMEQADIVEALMDHLNIHQTHVLAHDYGDTVAQEMLARYNSRAAASSPAGLQLHSVCLLNGGIFPATNFPMLGQKALLVPYVKRILARLMNIVSFKRGFGEVFGPETQPTPQEFNDFWAALLYNNGQLVSPDLLEYIPQRAANRDRWTGALQQANIPVHVIYGPADPVNPPGFVDYYKKTVPEPSISVLRTHIGHYPQWEDPAATTQAYMEFIDTIIL